MIMRKYRPKNLGIEVGTIIKYENQHGVVEYNQGHLRVKFPETHDSACFYDQKFQLNGTLMPDCENVIIKVVHAPKQFKRIELTAWVCRDGNHTSISRPATSKPSNAIKLYSTEFVDVDTKPEDLYKICRELNEKSEY